MTSEDTAHRRERLREFLRARRARISPAEVGLPVAGRRRTPGLRREEVAMRAGVGVSWYTWLEQGREISVSGEVLDAVASALLLSEAERAHLYLLAGLNPPVAVSHSRQEVSSEVLRLLEAWGQRPAVLRDRSWNILAFNDSARAVFGFDGGQHNCLETFFTNPRYRAMPEVWAAAAPAVAGAYRADAAHFSGDSDFARVVAKLKAASPEFEELWERHEVAAPEQAVNALRHPEVGELYFETTTLTVAHHPEWSLILYNPQAGTDTAGRLERLHRLRLSA
ncbi:helix-turn-helix transcriptional regulator [Nocardia goodfellowii]|uniref:Transcriptional regulator with XRE-family HTH domain n=1 Tax=Nocardia goodfellowii TaxID=882446 RepID=A0ABS4QFJ3_9NOCA|nr:helix-turn-helix transcriptional regulator [Nocardia goodfellowii]MBP2190477.1 transcriptional regulator with XRE-family HTH domain [Nocardia goodfellowii]